MKYIEMIVLFVAMIYKPDKIRSVSGLTKAVVILDHLRSSS